MQGNMKIKKNYLFLFVMILLCGSCQKASEYQDMLFITGTETQPTTKFTIDGPSSMGLTVTATDKVENETKVTLKIRPDLLDAYNKANGCSYEMPPEGSFELQNNEVILRQGAYISSQAKLNILSTEEFAEGAIYCIPVSIVSANGGMNVLETSRTTFIIINRVLITKAVDLKGSTYFTVPTFVTSTDVNALGKITMECKVYVNSFCSVRPYISSVMGIEENFLLRFGDVSCDNDQLQMAGATIGDKRYPMTTSTHFSVHQWYHVAIVYDGTTLTLYVNGEKDTFTGTAGGTINLNDEYCGGFHLGFSERGRKLNGYISEARVWNRALTPTELQDNICYVDPTSNGLLAYWRFNGESQEGKIMDLTGHGHDAVATGTINWIDNVRCPF
jgi:hypothetical protein